MDRDKLVRAAEIVADASELDRDARSAFVETACAGDADLLKEVRSLLAHAGDADQYFGDMSKRLGIAAASGREHDAGRDLVGRSGLCIGPYTLTEPIGSGGTGTVWRAERTDGQFEGDVAIKIVNPAAATAAALGRIGAEAQHLATLSHPNIARLLDAGIDGEKHPYLVLEFIDGVAIDAYCKQQNLDVRARIRLFIDVLRAVAHAHSHLIVHRDIKPANVLVDADGTVKLLDFGIAKLLKAESAAAYGQTLEMSSALTPEYAAPEQLRGKPVTTATDVYALGMVLYELLAGSSPRDTDSVDSLEALVDAATREPPRASSSVRSAQHLGTSDEALRRTLRGDVDNILQKAMAPEPERRYATAAEFASDLDRYLKGEPVSAMPATLSYRTRKFVSRHRGGAVTTLLTLVAILFSLALATQQMLEARKQRDAALYQQQRVMASNEFLRLLLAEVGPEGKALTLNELLDRGVAMLDRSFDPDYPFLGRMYYDLAGSYFTLSEKSKMLDLYARAEERARSHDDADLLAAILCARTRVRLDADPQQSAADVTEARTLLKAIDNPSEDSVLTCARAFAGVAEADGERQTAIHMLRDALETIDSSQLRSTQNRIFTMAQLANLVHRHGDLDEALTLHEQVSELMRRTGRGQTVNYLVSELNRSVLLHSMGEVRTAFEIRQRLLERMREMQQAGHSPIAFLGFYGTSLLRLAQYDAALQAHTEERDLAADAGNENRAAQSTMLMGRILTEMGRFDEAQAALDEAHAVFTKSPRRNDRLLQFIRISNVRVLLGRGDIVAASDAIAAELSSLDYPDTLTAPGLDGTLRVAAAVALAAGDAAAAERYADDCYRLSVTAARDPASSANVGGALLLRAKARLMLSRPDAAAKDLESAREALENGYGNDHPETLEARELLRTLRRDA